jgi:hypothetical protein
MNVPLEKPLEPPAEPVRPQPVPAPSNDNWITKIDSAGLAKSLSIGALLLSFSGWLIHSYGIPAMSSLWEEMIRPRVDNLIMDEILRNPRIHDFMVAEINSYLMGKISSTQKPNEVGAKLKGLVDSSDRIETISNSLFGGVDSVYTIATEYGLEQVKDSTGKMKIVPTESNMAPVRLLVYADPNQHCIWAFVQAKGDLQRGPRKEHLNLTIKLNDLPLVNGENVPAFGQEIGKFVKKRQGTGGSGKEEDQDIKSASFSENIQRIEIRPDFPAFDPIQIVGSSDNIPEKSPVAASLKGYILVTRRRTENQSSDCTQTPVTASSGNGVQ